MATMILSINITLKETGLTGDDARYGSCQYDLEITRGTETGPNKTYHTAIMVDNDEELLEQLAQLDQDPFLHDVKENA